MELYMVDINIVFDIIYYKRTRHSKAKNFYENFDRKICINNVINEECYNIINGYSHSFVSDFGDYLNNLDSNWNKLGDNARSEILDNFIITIENNNKSVLPFYKNMIEKIYNNSLKLNELREYLLELPGEMIDYLQNAISEMFTMVHPIVDRISYINEVNLSNFLINRYFKKYQLYDIRIFISLLHLINNGIKNEKNIDIIEFYTCDIPFFKNFNNIRKNRCNIYREIKMDYFSNAIDKISFKNL